MTEEQWADAPSAPGIRVSTLGRIQGRSGRIINGWWTDRGYQRVDALIDGKVCSFQVHRQVLMAFCGLPTPGVDIGRHINGIKSDNRLENLAWGTIAENNWDCVLHGHHRNAKKTHCIRNHPLSGSNLFITSAGVRQCVACRAARPQDYAGAAALREWANANGLACAPVGRIPNAVHVAWEAKCDEGVQS